jgi:hypothetical protein
VEHTRAAAHDIGDLILTIKCQESPDRRMGPGMGIQLSLRNHVFWFVTAAPTDPYISPANAKLALVGGVHLLMLDRASAWVNWEAILDPTGQAMYSRRTSREKLPTPNLMNWDKPSYHTLTMDHAGADLGGSAFGSGRRWAYGLEPEKLQAKGVEPGSIQVLHVVSDVVDTSGGARLSFVSEREKSRGRVIRPEELPRLLPDIRLYILQLPVGLDNGKRNGVCREKAALLRTFAAHLQLASDQIVITLPGLRMSEGTQVLEAIRRGVEKPDPTPAVSIFGELKAIRGQLFKTLPPDETEAGFDICYFG